MTTLLEQFTRDLTAEARAGKLDPVIGREREIEQLRTILFEDAPMNVILVGKPGVGKITIAEGLAQRMLDTLHIRVLDFGLLLYSSNEPGFVDLLERLAAELIEPPGILYVEHLDDNLNAVRGGPPEILDAILTFLSKLRLIGEISEEGFSQWQADYPDFAGTFHAIQVAEPSIPEAIQMIRVVRHRYVAHHHLDISDTVIEAAVRLSVKYLPERALPDKAIDVIDEAASRVRVKARHPLENLSTRDIADVIAAWIGKPVDDVE